MSAPKKAVALRIVRRMWIPKVIMDSTTVQCFCCYPKESLYTVDTPVAVLDLRPEAVEKAVDRIRKAIEQRPRPNYSLDRAKETYKQMMDRNKKIERDGARAVLAALVGGLPK